MTHAPLATTLALAFFLAAAPVVRAEPWQFKEQFLPHLVKAVPTILSQQDKETGRFGSGIWIVRDQELMYPLAAAWSINHPDNPHYHSEELLEAVMAAGDALIEDQDAKGMWVFRKKDGSTWGDIYMPWTYSRWIRTFDLIKDAMPPERRAKWEKALTLGFEGIARQELNHIHNIPVHHAMALYHAGQSLKRPEWSEQATAFMKKVVAAQDPGGFWSEGQGPVVGYNNVYIDSIGVYYALSGDKTVLPALEKAAAFQANFVYPDGSSVATIDERNPYHFIAPVMNVGFTYSPTGRAHLQRQWEKVKAMDRGMAADGAASMWLYGQEGEQAAPAADGATFVLGDNDAMTRRQGPWFACLSAYTAPVPRSRWVQDRQNFLSLYHDEAGVFLGGGNTKLQPLWSTFTVGDVSLLKHKPGNESPNFVPPKGLVHVPASATLDPETTSLILDYDGTACAVQVDLSNPDQARITYMLTSQPAQPVEAHATLLPRMKTAWRTESGKSGKLSSEPVHLGPGEAGAWFEHHGVRISLPPQASIAWPVLPHNPYRKDGRAEPREGRIVITLPFSPELLKHELIIGVSK